MPISTPDRHRVIIVVTRILLLSLTALVFGGLAGCNLPSRAIQTPTLSVTQAYQTVEAKLTQAIALTPDGIPSPTATRGSQGTEIPATSTPSPIPTTPTKTGPSPTPLCDQAAPGAPIDVTIPDNTEMQPGQLFTKVWRIQNAGTCTWTAEYALVWFSGEKLNAPVSIPLSGDVAPSQIVELAVDMVAPEENGTYQSNWKLRNASDVLFGIGPNGNSAFWVRIVVVESATATLTATLPITTTPTATPTTEVQASGSAILEASNTLDLDTNQVNSGSSEDLIFQAGEQNHTLDPLGTAAMTVYGSSQPNISECQTITLSADPVIVEESLAVGTYLCYRTDMALPGWALVTSFDTEASTLSLEILTWAIP